VESVQPRLDSELLADGRNGDGQALSELFERHYTSSVRVARRILRSDEQAYSAEPAPSRSAHPRTYRIPRFHSKQDPGEPTMNLIELQRALGQLRLGGMATVLENRLRQRYWSGIRLRRYARSDLA